jgi:hypothetical protein
MSGFYSMGFGDVELDDWGQDGGFGFSGDGEIDGDPVDGSNRGEWRFSNGRWYRVPLRPTTDHGSIGPAPEDASLTPSQTEEQRIARLEAIRELRTPGVESSGTNVAIARREDDDPSGQAQGDAARQYALAAQRKRERQDRPDAVAMAPANPNAAVGTVPSAPVTTPSTAPATTPPAAEDPSGPAVSTPPTEVVSMPPAGDDSTPPAEEVSTPPGGDMLPSSPPDIVDPPSGVIDSAPVVEEQGVAGDWTLQDMSSGVAEVTITETGGATTLTGMGSAIMLERDGDTYYGDGATLFGKGGHQIRLVHEGNQIQFTATHPEGGSFSTLLVR